MARQHYSKEFKAHAISELEGNRWNYRLTSRRTGVNQTTLRKWWRDHLQALVKAEAEADALSELRQVLIENALMLAKQLRDSNGSVTFTQRATAMNQIIDKLIRLIGQAPDVEVQEVMRLAHEEELEDGTDEDVEDRAFEETTSEAKEDSHKQGSL